MANRIDTLRIQFSRYAVLYGIRSRSATGNELLKLNTAIGLLNQAQAVVGSSENEAKKLLALAKNIAAQEVKDESKKRQGSKLRGSTNESRKESSNR